MHDHPTATEAHHASMSAAAVVGERVHAEGRYTVVCHNEHGEVLWREAFDNVVTTVGQNQLLTNGLSTTAYLFPISGASFSAVSVNDTMTSHSGWLEADGTNAPEYSGNRPGVTFGSPSGGASSITPVAFVFSNSGTVQGLAMVFGSGASATQGNTGGVLLSAGTLSAAQPVISGNTITASYTLTL